MRRSIKRFQTGDARAEQASSLPLGEVNVKFTAVNIHHNGKVYNCAELEKLAEEGDEAALQVIAELVALQSGVIEVTEVVADDQNDQSGDDQQNGDGDGGQNQEGNETQEEQSHE